MSEISPPIFDNPVYPAIAGLSDVSQVASNATLLTFRTTLNTLIDRVNGIKELGNISILNVIANTSKGMQEIRLGPYNYIGMDLADYPGLEFETGTGKIKAKVDGTTIGIDNSSGELKLLQTALDSIAITVNQVGHGFTPTTYPIPVRETSAGYVQAYCNTEAQARVAGLVVEKIDDDNFVLLLAGKILFNLSNSPETVYYLSASGDPDPISTTAPTNPAYIKKAIAIGAGTYGIFINDSGDPNYQAFTSARVWNFAGSMDLDNEKIINLANGTNPNDAVNVSQLTSKLDISGGTMSGTLNMGKNKITNIAEGTSNAEAVNFFQLNQKLNSTGGTMSGTLNMGNNRITNLSNGVNSTDAASVGQLNGKLSTTGGSMTGPISMGNNKITNVATPTDSGDAVSKSYADGIGSGRLPTSGGTMTGQIDMGSNKITNLANGTGVGDAVNKGQLDLKLNTSGGIMTGTITMSGAEINMGSNKITGVANGTNPTDAVNKSQLDAVSGGGSISSFTYMDRFSSGSSNATSPPSSPKPYYILLNRGGTSSITIDNAVAPGTWLVTISCHVRLVTSGSASTKALQIRINDYIQAIFTLDRDLTDPTYYIFPQAANFTQSIVVTGSGTYANKVSCTFGIVGFPGWATGEHHTASLTNVHSSDRIEVRSISISGIKVA